MSHPPPNPTAKPSHLPALLIIFTVALVVRLIYIATVRDFILVTHLVGDAATYDKWARTLVANNWGWNETFYQAPLYPYFLATIYRCISDTTMAVRIIQCALSSVACTLLAWSAMQLINRRAGMATGLILALYAPAIYFDGILQKTAVGFFLFAVVIAITSSLIQEQSRWKWGLLGIATGLLALTRENALALVPIFAIWSVIHARRTNVAQRIAAPALLIAGFTIAVAPAALHNHRVGGELAITTFQLGPNFYIGNHDGASGRYDPMIPGRETPEFERTDATALAEQAAGRKLTPREVSNHWLDRSLTYIRQQPVDWLKLLAYKLALTFNHYEIPDTESYELFCNASWLLGPLAIFSHLGLLLPLAAIGIVLTWPQRRQLAIFYAMLIVMTAAIAVFFLMARYRFLLVPILAIFAGGGLIAMIDHVRTQPWNRLAPALLAAIAVAIPANMKINPESELHAAQLGNLGVALALENRLPDAIPHFTRAVELNPTAPRLRQFLAQALAQTGRFADAVPHYRVALESRPNDPNLHFNLAVALENSGKPENARHHYQLSLQANPDDPVARAAIERLTRKVP